MRSHWYLLLAIVVVLKSLVLDAQEPKASAKSMLTQTRQLTFDGQRAGEGYFSQDGELLVFQSERRADNPFFQIYLMDLTTGDFEAISPGVGKTTCAWIHPDNRRVLFSSTHDDPEARQKQQAEFELRASGKERRYSWDYDLHYEIYVFDRQSHETINLTNTPGYDAEASYSPDGKWIVFASNRAAYADPLTAQEKQKFETDPAWGIDLYLMQADGSQVRRLTTAPGYDGGPFFSPDGQSICYRHFAENGATAEIMTLKLDEQTPRVLTRLNAMSWAPYYHPSGKYLIFTTNLHGFSNFELYIVDVEGKQAPVRVTQTEGFDGLPVFSPQGDRLCWTSNRTTGQKSQLFVADWNHDLALESLQLTSQEMTQADDKQVAEQTAALNRAEILPVDLVRHVEYLCRPELAGRLTGTQGEQRATAYVASYFEDLGLLPAGDQGDYFQPFEFTAGIATGSDNRMAANFSGADHDYQLDVDYRPVTFSKTGPVSAAPVVFAGYGLVTPQSEEHGAYDSYVHLDVKDKWVLMFRFLPENISAEKRQFLARYSSLRYKTMVARDLGAAGVIVVSGPTSQVKEQLVPDQSDGSFSGSSLPILSITDELAKTWLAVAQKDLQALQASLDEGEPQMGFELEGLTVQATIDLVQQKQSGRNVIARLQLGDQPAASAVLVGAHVDHLGKGRSSSSLAKDQESNLIHYGADDNASGVASMLEIAEYLVGMKAAGKLQGPHDLIFAAWSGEELGLLGAHHYVETFDNPHADPHAPRPIVACLNLDMVGRLRESLVLQGIGSSDVWTQIIEQKNAPLGLKLTLQDDCYLPTDASAFYLAGVPILSAFTGSHEEYHTPRDTPDLLNYGGTVEISKLMALIARGLVLTDGLPDYKQQSQPAEQRRANLRAYLGTIPDYAAEVTGVKLSGVTKGAPADQAGLMQDDIIIELAGKKIDNIYDYTFAIEALKIGQQVDVKIIRGDKTLTLSLTPSSRD